MKNLFLLTLAVASLSTCKKDSENTPSKTDLLTSKNWRVSALTTTQTVATTGGSPTVTTVDQYGQLQPCEKDNFYKFNTNKTLILDEGATKCSANDPQTTSFTWDFNSDQTKLIISAGSSPTTDDILELSATTLRLKDTNTYAAGSTTYSTVSTITFTAF